jgi:hypothetical protein
MKPPNRYTDGTYGVPNTLMEFNLALKEMCTRMTLKGFKSQIVRFNMYSLVCDLSALRKRVAKLGCERTRIDERPEPYDFIGKFPSTKFRWIWNDKRPNIRWRSQPAR